MSKVLVLTVGGSSEPLITSIKRHKPDYVIFLCSADRVTPVKIPGSHHTVDGDGLPCREWNKEPQPSIVVRAGLKPGEYEKILISNIDSLADCYTSSIQAFARAREKYSDPDILVDYTGGTKTMSAGLIAASLDDSAVQIFLVSGERNDLVKVRNGTQRVLKSNWNPLLWQRRLSVIKRLFSQFNYNECLEVIDQTSPDIVAGSAEDQIIQVYQSLCLAFSAWDQFDHDGAMRYLEVYSGYLTNEKVFLGEIIKNKRDYLQNKEARLRLHLVYDIMRNAERRLLQNKFDDAVGRTYRALEMLAQICLFFNRVSINTSCVNIEQLPQELHDKYRKLEMVMNAENPSSEENSGLKLGLFRSYELLADLKHPLGKLIMDRKNKLTNLIRLRNESIFAHGLNPIDPGKAREFWEFVVDIIQEFEELEKIKHNFTRSPQFPRELPEKMIKSIEQSS
ncbi:MAG: TIGR02710 family CRISPR-associated protein [Syntrophomonadaceae bacterium]|nr:TIGR02710 family CRISPR-associated protein [Syntrophomonadaceae bacterium]